MTKNIEIKVDIDKCVGTKVCIFEDSDGGAPVSSRSQGRNGDLHGEPLPSSGTRARGCAALC